MRLAILLIGAITLLSANAKSEKPEPKKKGSLQKSSFQEIIDRYLFIGDFNEKPAERAISGEVFWRYPFKMAPQVFDFALDKADLDGMVYRVPGDGRIAEHFAKGRLEFLEGRYDDAHTTWLAGRMQNDKDLLTNRRLEFFLGVNAAQVLKREWGARKGDFSDSEIKRLANRVGYFLASAFILRRDIADPNIDKHAPWAFYNLSVIYHALERWNLLAGSTQEGLSTLLKQGRKDFRPQFRQMLAEVHIKNQDLLPAIQELDTAIRQDPEPREASKAFSRVGDIYYGLNNFELAEDVYTLASRVDETRIQFVPGQAALRAESLFWLGKFEPARQLMTAAVEASVTREKDWLTTSDSLSWARLRIADTWLAQLETASAKDRVKFAEQARLAYFRVESEHPSSEAARIAKVRGACMELPSSEGNNVQHARELLASAKERQDVPSVLMEIVEACLVGSYTDRERTPEMVAKVKDFVDRYPDSKFIDRMVPAVRDVQSTNIEPYFEKGQKFRATEFFEKKRKALYPKPSDSLSRKLFAAYVDTSRSEKAKEFWPHARGHYKTVEDLLRAAVFLSDISSKGRLHVTLGKDFKDILAKLDQMKWEVPPSKLTQEFVSRAINGPRAKDHLLWVSRAAADWAKDDKDSICKVSYPIASRIFEGRTDLAAKKVVRSHLDTIFPAKWTEVYLENSSCAQSWLDLEAKFFDQKSLASRYAKRSDWKLDGPWLERAWTFSEELHKAGKTTEAQALWEKIAKESPPSSFESKMAKTRLAPPDTQVESLWR